MKQFPHLSAPGKIGTLELKNRVVKAPQVVALANIDGTVNERLVRYYRRQARGGTGLIITEYSFVDDWGSKSAQCQLGASKTEHIPGLAWLANAIREEGAKAGIQLEHCGRQKFLGTQPIVSCSSVPWPHLQAVHGDEAIPKELAEDEIWQIIAAFGDAALRAMMAGFDLVEIHGAHGYLITNFLSPHTNKRSDSWGGSLENRMRFLSEIIKDCRAKVGPSYPLTVRLSGSDYEPDGFGIQETIEVAKMVEALGIDAIHMSGGDHHQMIHQVTPGCLSRAHNTWAAEAVKKVVSIPVIASGSITTPDLAEDILSSGMGDFVGLGRPLWADPDWTRKAVEGRPEDIRPCIRCNDGCLDRTFFRYQSVRCSVNPALGREGELEISPAETEKEVVVVGGGPAGLEAARVCALRGHNVTVYEKGRLGGALLPASAPDFKKDIERFTDSLVTAAEKAGITFINDEATLASIKTAAPDCVIVASGALPRQVNVPGADRDFVHDAVDVLLGTVTVGNKVVVIGGGAVGTELALHLAEKGHDVTIAEMLDEIMADAATTDKMAHGEQLAEIGLPVLTGHTLVEIADSGVVLETGEGNRTEIPADTVVLAVGYHSLRTLADALQAEEDLHVVRVGDCIQPGRIFDAIHSAYLAALTI